MKINSASVFLIFTVSSVFIFTATARNVKHGINPIPDAYKLRIATSVVTGFLDQLKGRFKAPRIFSEYEVANISFPVLPPLPDPLILNNTNFEIPADSDLGSIIQGYLFSFDSSVKGLSTVFDDLTVSPTPDYEFLLSYALKANFVAVEGLHGAALTVVEPTVQVESYGVYSLTISNISIGLTLKVKILIEDKLSISSASLDLGFGALEAYTTQTTLDGSPVDWTEFSQEITEIFPSLWASIKPNVDSILLFAINSVIKDCALTDLVGGDLQCIFGSDAVA